MLEEIFALLSSQNATLAVAESCTGGKICAALVSFPGISSVFNEGFITYSNQAKVKNLGVAQQTLDDLGAVSSQCAAEMSSGAAKAADASYGLATTGIAGPDGGSPQKPVGLVYISCFHPQITTTIECNFSGNREEVRNAATERALALLLDCLKQSR